MFRKKKKKDQLPSQLKPFPEYPDLHVQLKLPIVFVQFAFISHPPSFVKHSLISIDPLFIFFSLTITITK